MDQVAYCSSCSEILIKGFEEETKIRSKIIIIRNGDVYAVCKSCNLEVLVPLKVDTSLLKSLLVPAPAKKPRLYIKK